MDLSKLTRPAILCQCSRCSSSLAALENEWAKLSNSYSIAAGWLSVEPHRISISSEKKLIPQSSEMSLLRGRILQEISCKLCQQKLGVLCALDDGPNIFWKLSKVSFRGIVTMRTVEPIFKDGVLERLVSATPKEPRGRRESGALIPTGPTTIDTYNMSVEQQIQHQGLSLDQISSSVNNLQDTMSELKDSFTSLRIELNGPGRFPSNMASYSSNDFNMVTTVLKELKLKSEEIEKLKLEIEALKLKNRYMEEQTARHYNPLLSVGEALPEVQSPGLLQESRKRPWPDSFPSGRTHAIADSFDDEEDNTFGDFTLADIPMPPMKIPLKEAEPNTMPNLSQETTTGSPRLRIEITQSRQQSPHLENITDTLHKTNSNIQQQAVTKRPRLSQSVDKTPRSSDKPRPGRPRKSFSQATRPDVSQTPKPAALSEQTSSGRPSPLENSGTKGPRPTRSRSLRSRSRPPTAQPLDVDGIQPGETPTIEMNGQEDSHDIRGPDSTDQQMSSEKENPQVKTTNGVNGENKNEANKKRKAQVAARDVMARLAMQREEAMETE